MPAGHMHCVYAMQVFSALYGTNELLSSFDSINVVRPGPDDGEGWLHVDQAPLRRGMYCIQGLVNLVDVSPNTTGGRGVLAGCARHKG